MFRNRRDAAQQLAARLRTRPWVQPLVLAIPRGGVVTGAVLARELGAELDVVLARKLRAPYQPELAIGAIGEDGQEYLTPFAREVRGVTAHYLAQERARQLANIEQRQQRLRAIRPRAEVAGRSVILTDDGIATGATMLAALHVVQSRQPLECVVAVPVASPEALALLKPHCQQVECLHSPANFGSVGAFYAEFLPVEDDEVLRLLSAGLA